LGVLPGLSGTRSAAARGERKISVKLLLGLPVMGVVSGGEGRRRKGGSTGRFT